METARGQSAGAALGPSKSTKCTRSITLGKAATERFEPWLDGVKGDALIFIVPTTGEKKTGSYLSRIVWTTIVAPLLKGVDGAKSKLHVRATPDDLRHSHASTLIEAKVDFMTIQRRLGHESITTTIGTCGNLRNEKTRTPMRRWIRH